MLTLEALADRPIWVGWRPETKVPYDPKTRTHAKCDNSTTSAPRNDAELWALESTKRSVGIVLTRIDAELSLAGIDWTPAGTRAPALLSHGRRKSSTALRPTPRSRRAEPA